MSYTGGLSEEDFGAGDPRCPLVLLLDTSDSMGFDRSPLPLAIDQLNAGLQALADTLAEDSVAKRRVEVLVVPFGGTPSPLGDFELARDWKAPVLKPKGGTPMGAAVSLGLRLAGDRRRELQAAGTVTYRPWVFLLTDGDPTDDMSAAPRQVADAEQGKLATFWCIAATGADLTELRKLTPEKPILQLDEADWSSLFKWMSAAMSSVMRSAPGAQATINPWTLTA